jgi:hypothetical protein
MAPKEATARIKINKLLEASGWPIQRWRESADVDAPQVTRLLEVLISDSG